MSGRSQSPRLVDRQRPVLIHGDEGESRTGIVFPVDYTGDHWTGKINVSLINLFIN